MHLIIKRINLKHRLIFGGIAILALASAIVLFTQRICNPTGQLHRRLSQADALTILVAYSGNLQALVKTYDDLRRFSNGPHTSFEVVGWSSCAVPFMVVYKTDQRDIVRKWIETLTIKEPHGPACRCLGDVLLQFHCPDRVENVYVKSDNFHLRIAPWQAKGDTYLTLKGENALKTLLASAAVPEALKQLNSLPLGPNFPGTVHGKKER